MAEQLMSEQSASGQSKQDFCAARKINPATFYYWQKRLRDKKKPDEGFRSVRIAASKTVEVQLAPGRWMAIRSADSDMLAEILVKIGMSDA